MQRSTPVQVVMAAALIAFTGTAAPGAVAAAAPSGGLVAAILKDADIGDCAAKSKLSHADFVAKAFDLKDVTLKGGERMTVATGMDACVCAAQNCPTLVVLAEKNGAYRTVLSGWTIASKVLPDGSAVLDSHDSAAVSDRSVYRWNGTTYAVVKAERVDARSGTVKPMSIPLVFAAGASSATVSGKVALSFGDVYTFAAAAGQTISLALASQGRAAPDTLILLHGDTILADAGRAWSGKLPATGQYRLIVEGAEDSLIPYTLRIAIH
jgi:hypothetical protein